MIIIAGVVVVHRQACFWRRRWELLYRDLSVWGCGNLWAHPLVIYFLQKATSPNLLTLPKQFSNWGLNIQTYKSIRAILTQTTISSFPTPSNLMDKYVSPAPPFVVLCGFLASWAQSKFHCLVLFVIAVLIFKHSASKNSRTAFSCYLSSRIAKMGHPDW